MLKTSKHSAFSLFEVSVSIVILGAIGLVCSSMLLDISKHIAYTQAKNDTTSRIALLKIENLLENAIIESLQDSKGQALKGISTGLSFYSVDESLLLGGGNKNASTSLQGDTLLPHISLEVLHSHNDTLYFSTLRGWQSGMNAYLITKPQSDFIPYVIKDRANNILTLSKPPAQPPSLILPITHHSLRFDNGILWLDSVPIIDNVLSFEVLPISLNQGILLELKLCVKTPSKAHCEKSGIWLDSIVEFL